MRERTPGMVREPETVRESRVQPMHKHGLKMVVWIARVLGLIIIGLAIAIGFNASDIAVEWVGGVSPNEVWAFFHAATAPLGIGFLIVVAAEILDRVDEWLKHYAWPSPREGPLALLASSLESLWEISSSLWQIGKLMRN